jgi:hypothetical protein
VDDLLTGWPAGAQLLWAYHPAFEYGRHAPNERELPYWPEAGEQVALRVHRTRHRNTAWLRDCTAVVLGVLPQPPRAPSRALVVQLM